MQEVVEEVVAAAAVVELVVDVVGVVALVAVVDVEEIGLWIMGSKGPDNEYVSCGSVKLR